MNSIIRQGLVVALAFVSIASNAKAIYVEDDARLDKAISNELAIEFAKYIRVSGYSCNSVSAVTPAVMSRAVTVVCNDWTYSYNVEDKGGNWIVTVE